MLQETQGALYSSRSLQSKLQLAEQAQLEARNMEHDYEEVVHALEVELTQLRIQLDSQLVSCALSVLLFVSRVTITDSFATDMYYYCNSITIIS